MFVALVVLATIVFTLLLVTLGWFFFRLWQTLRTVASELVGIDKAMGVASEQIATLTQGLAELPRGQVMGIVSGQMASMSAVGRELCGSIDKINSTVGMFYKIALRQGEGEPTVPDTSNFYRYAEDELAAQEVADRARKAGVKLEQEATATTA